MKVKRTVALASTLIARPYLADNEAPSIQPAKRSIARSARINV